jgi:hypothetical protein
LTALIAVNAVLVAASLAGLMAARAQAQPGGQRARGNYVMVPGRVSGISGSAIYIVDSVNQELLALRYLRSTGKLDTFAYRNLAADSAQGAKSR